MSPGIRFLFNKTINNISQRRVRSIGNLKTRFILKRRTNVRKSHVTKTNLRNTLFRHQRNINHNRSKTRVLHKIHGQRPQFINQSFSPQHEFSRLGWSDLPKTSIFNRMQDKILDWPSELGPVLVLSIRPERMKQFEHRMGPWMKHMRRFPATDGRLIDPRRWHRERRVVAPNMNPGRLGCYDTHVRIWETIAKSPHSVVTVLEDDVDFDYRNAVHILSRFQEDLSEIKQIEWDFLCWGHGPWAFGKNIEIPGLRKWRRPGTCQGFFAYTIKRSLAQRLVQQCRPYKNSAVDKWFFDDFISRNHVKVLTADPRLCWVVEVASDTNRRKI